MIQIRVGIDSARRSVLRRAAGLNAPILVSANSLWNKRKQRFSGWESYAGHDVALDSAGFVVMAIHGGSYPWTVDQYVALAEQMRPTWWAQMDFCCEPQIAKDSTAVWKRIDLTASHLHECMRVARERGAAPPLPVLQGWHPSDYTQGPIYNWPQWPDLVGIGSVCRRNVTGQDGILAVVNALDAKVPRHVRFHLFGVKSQALQVLARDFPHRIASVDSMAWNMDARWLARHKKISCDSALRAHCMERWFTKQQATLHNQDLQLNLFK